MSAKRNFIFAQQLYSNETRSVKKKHFPSMKTIKLSYTKLSLYSCFRFQKIFAGAITKINNEMPSVSAKQHLVNSP